MARREVKVERSKRGSAGARLQGDIRRFKNSLAIRLKQAASSPVVPYVEERLSFTIPSDVKYLDSVLDHVGSRMVEIGIFDADDSDILVALDEAIVNAIKHGNNCDPGRMVQIVVEMNEEGAKFIIRDEGGGFCRRSVPDPTCADRLLEPSGRGLLLINHIMDDVRYNECGNEICMYKKARRRRAPPG